MSSIFDPFSALDPARERAQIDGAIGSGGGGLTLVSSGKITTPVSHFDVVLPAGYFKFILELANFTMAPADHLSATISYNGGSTFATDSTNFDTWGVAQILKFGVDGDTAGPTGIVAFNSDSLINLSNSNSLIVDGTLSIYPGDASSQVRMRSDTQESGFSGATVKILESISFFLNPGATVPPSNGRANLLRFQPYGNGDTPPTSTNKIASGYWAMLGVPSP